VGPWVCLKADRGNVTPVLDKRLLWACLVVEAFQPSSSTMKDQFHPVIPAKAGIYDQHKHPTPYPHGSQDEEVSIYFPYDVK